MTDSDNVAPRDTMGTPGDEANKPTRTAMERVSDRQNFAEFMQALFGPENGVDLNLPPREPGREPPSFG